MTEATDKEKEEAIPRTITIATQNEIIRQMIRLVDTQGEIFSLMERSSSNALLLIATMQETAAMVWLVGAILMVFINPQFLNFLMAFGMFLVYRWLRAKATKTLAFLKTASWKVKV